jgi:hypothetical protein
MTVVSSTRWIAVHCSNRMESWSGVRFPVGTGPASRPALEPTQLPIQWVLGTISLGVKWPGREADHSPPSSAEDKEWVELYLHSPNTASWRCGQLKHRDNFTFYVTLLCVTTRTAELSRNNLSKLAYTRHLFKSGHEIRQGVSSQGGWGRRGR